MLTMLTMLTVGGCISISFLPHAISQTRTFSDCYAFESYATNSLTQMEYVDKVLPTPHQSIPVRTLAIHSLVQYRKQQASCSISI